MGKVFVIGDIHGAYRALTQCFERSGFDYDNDQLICLGDVCDGWPETKRCIAELLSIRNLVYIMGNHDTWLLEWMQTGEIENIWYVQGGEASIMSYAGKAVPQEHILFLKEALSYHVSGSRLFVHAGFDPEVPIHLQTRDTFLWDRTLARTALNRYSNGKNEKLTPYDEVYLGHTPIPYHKPIQACDVWMMDTGAGWNGNLSMMNVDTKEVFSSDLVPGLYPGIKGRSRG